MKASLAALAVAVLAGCDLSYDGINLASCADGGLPGARCPSGSGSSGGTSGAGGTTSADSSTSGGSRGTSGGIGTSGTSGGTSGTSSAGTSGGTTGGMSNAGGTSGTSGGSSGGMGSSGGTSGTSGGGLAPWGPSWLSLLAGSPGNATDVSGSGDLALASGPYDVAFDGAGHLYFTDSANDTVRTLDLTTGLVTTLAGQPGVAATIDGPSGTVSAFDGPLWIAYDPAGYLYVDGADDTVRRVTIASGATVTVAGQVGGTSCVLGTGLAAQLYGVGGLAYDGQGHLYLADPFCFSILEFDTTTWAETLVAGSNNSGAGCTDVDGAAAAAQFTYPSSLTYDGAGHLFVANSGASFCDGSAAGETLRELDVNSQIVSTLAGSPGQPGSLDGVGAAARFDLPLGIAFDGQANLFVTDSDQTIREVNVATQKVSTVAGSVGVAGTTDGFRSKASFINPAGLGVDPFGDLFIADPKGEELRELFPATGVVTTVVGSPSYPGTADGNQGTARLNQPFGLAYDGANTLYVSDFLDYTIRKLDIRTGATTPLAGVSGQSGSTDGTGAGALFLNPTSLAYDPGAGLLYVVDSSDDQLVRTVDVTTGKVVTVAGSIATPCGLGTGLGAEFNALGQLWFDGNHTLYGADTYCFRLVALDTQTWAETLVAGNGQICAYADGPALQAGLSYASALTSDGRGNLYFVDSGSSGCSLVGGTVRKLNLSTLTVSTLAGTPGVVGTVDGIGAAANFNHTTVMAYDGVGSLFIAQTDSVVRRLDLATNLVTTVLGAAGSSGLILGPAPGGLDQIGALLVGPGPALYLTGRYSNSVLLAR